MLTIELQLNRKAHVLARVVMQLHRLALEIEELYMGPAVSAGIVRIRMRVNANPGEYGRVQANLYKLVDVLSVEAAGPEKAEAAPGP